MKQKIIYTWLVLFGIFIGTLTSCATFSKVGASDYTQPDKIIKVDMHRDVYVYSNDMDNVYVGMSNTVNQPISVTVSPKYTGGKR
jgi:hypothetical protein